jgi:DNA-binding winged helix-turn-helix (wHTH) protein
VARDEMRGQDTFVDFDHGLNTAVNKIREVLNDSASVPRYVTVPGKGYRFIAPVTLQDPADETAGIEQLVGEGRLMSVIEPTTLPLAAERLVATSRCNLKT